MGRDQKIRSGKVIKVISRGFLDQQSREGTEGAACSIGTHLKRPIPDAAL